MSGSTDEDTHSSPALVVRTASGGRGVRTLVPCGGAGRFVVMWPCHAPGQAGPQEAVQSRGKNQALLQTITPDARSRTSRPTSLRPRFFPESSERDSHL